MHFGFALPQYDYSVPGERPLSWETLARHATTAEDLGFTSLWLSDHLFLDIAKYGGSPDREGCFEPIVTLSALARITTRVRLGTLVALEALRPATMLAKAFATVDRVSGGRIDVGLGAGWYEPDYTEIGMEMPSPGVRIARLRESVDVVRAMFGGGPVSYDGHYHRAHGALPAPAPQGNPRVFVGGTGDRLLQLVAQHADGWNACWKWTPATYRARLDVLERACEKVDRDPATVWRTLGLYALCGEDDADLARRYRRLQECTPGVLDRVTLDEFRRDKLVGTVDDVRAQVADWEELGIDTLILGAGAVPFQVAALDDVEMLAAALMA